MEFGMSLPQDFASINEVYRLVNSSPLVKLIDRNRIKIFMCIFSAKMIAVLHAKLYLTDIFQDVTFHIAFIPTVFSGRKLGISFKCFDKMRLIRKMALICNSCKR